MELPLELEPGALFDGSLAIRAEVRGGVYDIGCHDPAPQGFASAGDFRATIRSLPTLHAPRVRIPPLPQFRRVPVRTPALSMDGGVRAISTSMPSAGVGTIACLNARSASVLDGGCSALLGAKVHSGSSYISRIPMALASVDLNVLTEGERAGFLREAEAIKGIPPERAELLAVFRHVPIEMISRLRFLADSRSVEYSISAAPKRTQTRVHDMAVVRDSGNQDVHFVPHRTQCHTVPIAPHSSGQ